jgi:DNA-binding CsgD family transcriptional regulator
MLSVACLEWMNHIFDAALNTYLWVFPFFDWQDTNTFALRYCALRLAIALFCLAWSFCYQRIIRGLDKAPPPKILILLWVSAILSSQLLYAFTTRAAIEPRPSNDILLIVGTVGMLLCAAFMCLFYFYISSLKRQEFQGFAMNTAATPALWSPERGVSQALIEKYKLTTREVEVINQVLQGKVDKEIAQSLGIKLPTVHQHLQNIYSKTEARGRFALITLVRG